MRVNTLEKFEEFETSLFALGFWFIDPSQILLQKFGIVRIVVGQ
jgi:hypothetical protein